KLDMKGLDDEMQRTQAASHTLRGLSDLASTVSAADGTFELDYDRLPLARIFVTASVEKDGATFAVEKPVSGEDAGDLVVGRLPAVLVSVTAGRAPVEGATVSFLDTGGDVENATTDAKGLARHATGAPRVLVTASKPGFATVRADVALAAGSSEDSRLDLALAPSSPILGTVRGPDQQPLAGVPVVVEPPEPPSFMVGDAPPLAKTTTDADGHFSIDGLVAGRSYELIATPTDTTIL